MKRTLLILLLLGLVFSGLSVWIGLRVEATHHELIAALERRPHLRVLSSVFERGLLHSTAETTFELRGAAGALFQRPLEWAGRQNVRPRVGFRLVHRIDHGPASLWAWLGSGAVGPPIVAHVYSTLILDQEAWSELAAAVGELPAVQLQLRVAADGRVRGRVSMPAAELQPRDVEPGDAPRWVGRLAGFRAELEVAPESDVLQVTLRAGGLQLGGSEMTLEVGEWNGQLELPLGESPRPSRGEHVVQNLILAWPAPEQGEPTRIAIDGIAWTTEGGREELLVEAGFDQVQWNALEATDVRIGLEALRELDAGDPPPEAHLVSLLGFLPELNITGLDGQTPSGPFHVSGRVRFDPTVAEGESDLEGELELRLPGGWADALAGDDDELLGAWLDAGELERDGEGYLGDLRFEAARSGAEQDSSELITRLLGLLPEAPVGSPVEEADEELVDADAVAADGAHLATREGAPREAPAAMDRPADPGPAEPPVAPFAPPASPAP